MLPLVVLASLALPHANCVTQSTLKSSVGNRLSRHEIGRTSRTVTLMKKNGTLVTVSTSGEIVSKVKAVATHIRDGEAEITASGSQVVAKEQQRQSQHVQATLQEQVATVRKACTDFPSWTDDYGDGCDWYDEPGYCSEYAAMFAGSGGSAIVACCCCGGGTRMTGEDCDPYSEEACAQAATSMGFTEGGGGHEFASSSSSYTSGCYTYQSGEYKGMAFYGRSGSITSKSTPSLTAPQMRVPGFDCVALVHVDPSQIEWAAIDDLSSTVCEWDEHVGECTDEQGAEKNSYSLSKDLGTGITENQCKQACCDTCYCQGFYFRTLDDWCVLHAEHVTTGIARSAVQTAHVKCHIKRNFNGYVCRIPPPGSADEAEGANATLELQNAEEGAPYVVATAGASEDNSTWILDGSNATTIEKVEALDAGVEGETGGLKTWHIILIVLGVMGLVAGLGGACFVVHKRRKARNPYGGGGYDNYSANPYADSYGY